MKLLVAGGDSDTRAIVEADVRRALAARPPDEVWTVSLVRVGGRWSVTIDGPEPRFRGLSLMAADDRLAEAIGEAVGAQSDAQAGPGSSAGSDLAAEAVGVRSSPHGGATHAGASGHAHEAAPSAGETRTPLRCEACGRDFAVVYEARAGEPLVQAAVACPHCWQMNRAEIGDWAAAGRDYRAEKA